jgi:hypothetical protein
MQRYFFDVWQDEQHHRDTDGQELRSPEAATEEVCGIMGELSKAAFTSGKRPHDIRVVARDQSRQIFEASVRLDWRSFA